MFDERDEDEKFLFIAVGFVGIVLLVLLLVGLISLVLASDAGLLEGSTDGTEQVEDADATIAADVEAALLAAGLTIGAPDGVTVSVVDGVVTLTGTVADEDARAAAVAAATNVPGVTEVIDELVVSDATAVDPTEEPSGQATEEPTQAPAAEAAAITATIGNGQVVLTGAVPTADVAELVVQAARDAYEPDLVVVDRLDIDADVTVQGASLTLAGGVASDEARAAALAAAEAALPAVAGIEIIDELTIDEGPSTLEQLNELFANGSVLFASGSAELSDEAVEVLDQAVELLLADPTLNIEITGHTDSQGPAEANLQLSLDRALAVADYLIDNGIDEDRIPTVEGAGEDEPIASNATAEGRAQNRRIEFRASTE